MIVDRQFGTSSLDLALRGQTKGGKLLKQEPGRGLTPLATRPPQSHGNRTARPAVENGAQNEACETVGMASGQQVCLEN